LAARGVAAGRCRMAYVLVLWAGAVIAWLFLIATNNPPLRH
jgi:hypothetical protein